MGKSRFFAIPTPFFTMPLPQGAVKGGLPQRQINARFFFGFLWSPPPKPPGWGLPGKTSKPPKQTLRGLACCLGTAADRFPLW